MQWFSAMHDRNIIRNSDSNQKASLTVCDPGTFMYKP